ncbi:hypothetical protein [Desulfuribacillus alkaliarsenatis]|uniref:Uncharacterized protein n=1 Tax=Desulfuribacillus alkaliarsenatis TaxID=766136 RepID=A0A1E5G3G2_9FIRM|nr:hypothetical protein [Desulfuribacillus alkaliarsenatis]OEF97122.1 hypothetical protein BHF68_05870 [Desulfuribacillus alkaliarsenatis]
MLLQSNQRVYSIYQTLRSYKDLQVYLANEASVSNQATQKQYLINEFRNPELIRNCIEDMLSLQKDATVAEFVDVFTSGACLYTVFTYSQPYLLKDYVARHRLSFGNRVNLLKNILFKLSTYSQAPLPVLIHLVDTDNIHVHPDETIYFSFAFHPEQLQSSSTINTLYLKIANLVLLLFPKETDSRSNKQLQMVLKKCERAVYQSIPEIVKDVERIDTSTFTEKLKNWFQERKSQVQLLKNISLVALLLFFSFILYTRFIVPDNTTPVQAPVPVQQVGELPVSNGSPEQETEALEEQATEPALIHVDVGN